MKNRVFFLVALLLWGLSLVLTHGLRTSENLFPQPKAAWADYALYSYNDRADGGQSRNELHQDSSGLHFDWSLSGKIAYPYIGGGISWLRKNHSCADWRDYDSLEIRWRLTGKGSARLALHNLDPVRSDRNDPKSLRILMVVVPLDSIWQMSHLAFKDWSTPPWWFSQHRVTPNSEDRFMDQVCELEWDVPGTASQDNQGRLEISSIQLSRPFRVPFLLLLAFGPLVAGALLLWRWNRKPPLEAVRPRNTLTKNIPVEIHRQNDWMTLEQYLKEHYQEPELSAEFLCHHFGWNATKFTAIVKLGAGMNFKQALNRIRISASCTLLRESQASIATISDRVGFANVTHFNRVFKELQGQSPTDFREGTKVDRSKNGNSSSHH